MNTAKVAILGNFNEKYPPHYIMNNHFRDLQEKYGFTFEWIATEKLVDNADTILNGYSGIVAGSGPYLSKEGVISGIRYARQNNIPFMGTCSGFGYAVLEFGQSLFDLPEVYHPYEKPDLDENETFLQTLNFCSKEMHTITFKPVAGTLVDEVYHHPETISEESHCFYGVSRNMMPVFEKAGLVASGLDDEGEPKIMEYNRNDFFAITLFLPQFKSNLEKPHPLIAAFFEAVLKKAGKTAVAQVQ
jgi:CTP synthase (UTP-ammonia lyase)